MARHEIVEGTGKMKEEEEKEYREKEDKKEYERQVSLVKGNLLLFAGTDFSTKQAREEEALRIAKRIVFKITYRKYDNPKPRRTRTGKKIGGTN